MLLCLIGIVSPRYVALNSVAKSDWEVIANVNRHTVTSYLSLRLSISSPDPRTTQPHSPGQVPTRSSTLSRRWRVLTIRTFPSPICPHSLTSTRKFTSPILFPNSTVLPPTLTQISPITSPAHPLLTSLSCALLHPSDPSCTRTYIRHHLTTIPRLARLFTIIFSVLSLPSYAKFLATPLTALNALAARILRYTIFTSGSIGTSWSAICLFQSLLSPKFLSTQRFFLGGFIGGLWAFVVRKEGKGEFLYAARASVESVWKVGRKRGWWKGIKGGDVALFVMGLGMINVAYEREAEARRGKVVDKNLGRGVKFLRGDGTEVEEIEETREKA